MSTLPHRRKSGACGDHSQRELQFLSGHIQQLSSSRKQALMLGDLQSTNCSMCGEPGRQQEPQESWTKGASHTSRKTPAFPFFSVINVFSSPPPPYVLEYNGLPDLEAVLSRELLSEYMRKEK
ncbi:uncharacterized protein LOC142584729 [Dermacentor variabilis]|uniref:uncharacterized protein LOC142584729 n=1 Tax=Dermacentor variabilis TaxID=34621 RepID=UPI003F5C35D0